MGNGCSFAIMQRLLTPSHFAGFPYACSVLWCPVATASLSTCGITSPSAPMAFPIELSLFSLLTGRRWRSCFNSQPNPPLPQPTISLEWADPLEAIGRRLDGLRERPVVWAVCGSCSSAGEPMGLRSARRVGKRGWSFMGKIYAVRLYVVLA